MFKTGAVMSIMLCEMAYNNLTLTIETLTEERQALRTEWAGFAEKVAERTAVVVSVSFEKQLQQMAETVVMQESWAAQGSMTPSQMTILIAERPGNPTMTASRI